MKKLVLAGIGVGIAGFAMCDAAQAQSPPTKIRTDMVEKSRWHNAPKQYQIIDDRPSIRDFREAPTQPQYVDLPPGPQASGGYGGQGSGAMPAGGGPGAMMPAGGMQLGGPNQGFRSAPQGLPGIMNLPKSGFGGPSNIPAGGFRPKGLQNGSSTNLMGKLFTPPKAGPRAGAMPSAGGANYPVRQAAPASYSGGYGASTGGGGGGGMSSSGNVYGKLLRKN